MVRLFTSLVFWIFSVAAHATVVSTIETQIRNGQASRLEHVIEKLPLDLRSSFTFVYAGRAVLETSYEFPAAVLFGKDAKTLLSFNGHPNQRGFASLDVLEFDEKSGFYKPARFLFSPSREEISGLEGVEHLRGDVYLERAPKNCAGCHGPSHHPIFESSYPEWSGFYGSDRDHLYDPWLKTEIAGYKRFQKNVASNPRYSKLIFPSAQASKVSPYLDESTERTVGPLKALEYRPNLMFGSYLVRNNAHGIHRKMSLSPMYRELSPVLAFAFERCDFKSLDPIKVRAFQEKISNASSGLANFERLYLSSTFFLNSEHDLNRRLGAKIVAVLGITRDHWNLSHAAAVGNEYGYWSGYGDTYDVVYAKIVRELFTNEQIGALYDDQQVPTLSLKSLGETLNPKIRAVVCQRLAEKTKLQ